MSSGVLRELTRSLLLGLWLLLAQLLSAVGAGIGILLWELVVLRGAHLHASSPAEWAAVGALVLLLWAGMGLAAPEDARPGPAGAVPVLVIWSLATPFLWNLITLLLLPQELLRGALEQILESSLAVLLLSHALPPAALGLGLYAGWRRAKASGRPTE